MSNCAQRSPATFFAAAADLRKRSLLLSHADDAHRSKPFHGAWPPHHRKEPHISLSHALSYLFSLVGKISLLPCSLLAGETWFSSVLVVFHLLESSPDLSS